MAGVLKVLAQVVVIADTHVATLAGLPSEVRRVIEQAEWLVHCGDFTGSRVLEELRQLNGNLVAVYGNTDPGEVRRQLPPEVTFEVEGKQIAVIHPHWGGAPFGLEAELVAHFPQAHAILYGHTHEPYLGMKDGRLLLNPGQGYPSFMVPTTIGVLTVGREGLEGQIVTLT